MNEIALERRQHQDYGYRSARLPSDARCTCPAETRWPRPTNLAPKRLEVDRNDALIAAAIPVVMTSCARAGRSRGEQRCGDTRMAGTTQ
jgi:hypothetical protein